MKKHRIFIRILISYLLVTLIPIMILGALIFDLFNNTVKNEMITNQQNALQRFRISFDSIISEMDANAIQMLNSSQFSPTYLNTAYGNYIDVAQRLSSLSFTNTYISEVCYASRKLNTIYTKQTMYDEDGFNRFGPGYTNFADTPEDTFLYLIQNKKRYWLPVQHSGSDTNSREVLTYIVTNKVSDYPPTASIVYQIDRQMMEKLTVDMLNSTHMIFWITDAEDHVLFSYPSMPDEELFHTVQNREKTNEPFEIKINDDGCFVFRENSRDKSVFCTTIVSYDYIVAPIAKYRNFAFIVVLVISAVCFIIIAYSMRVNYEPVKAITHLISSLFRNGNGDDKSIADTEEFNQARETLLHYKEMDLKRTQDQITIKLLRGDYRTYDDYYQECALIDYPLPGPLFQMITMNITSATSDLETSRIEEISQFVNDNLKVLTNIVTLCYPEISTIYAIISKEKEDDEINLGLRLQQLQLLINKTFSATLSIGIGGTVTINDTAVSASQSSIACQYKFMRGSDAITFYNNVKKNQTPTYPYHEIDALYHAILQGNKELIQITMSTLEQYIKETDSLLYGTCLAYDILNTVIKATQQLNCSIPTLKAITNDPEKVMHSVEEIIQIVNIITDQVVNLISKKEETQKQDCEMKPLSQFEQIMDYISENYCNPTFSVKSLADHFCMSTSNLSHYFKKQTGQTISEYISLLRFEKAKELLRTSDITLQNIVSLCGYLHLSTLMRQFKQREDCTPASYRARYRG